jgi:hypothetical protein
VRPWSWSAYGASLPSRRSTQLSDAVLGRLVDAPAHLDGNFGKAENSGTRVQLPRRPRTARERAMGSKSFKALILANKIRKRLLIVGVANPNASSSS